MSPAWKRITFLSIVCLFAGIRSSFAVSPEPGNKTPEIVRQFFLKAQQQYAQSNLAQIMTEFKKNKIAAVPAQNAAEAACSRLSFSFPVLVGKFSDSGEDQWSTQHLQRELFDGPWYTGTMKEFYLQNSYDQFELNGKVFGWYQVHQTRKFYGNGDHGMGRTPWFIRDLLGLADPEIDFSQFDNDNDGVVETLFIVHYGNGAESSQDEDDIWSHSFQLIPAYQTDDDVKIKNYIIQPALSSKGNKMIEIGVFCHEFGHALGLPDLYDIDDSSEGIGEWGLMSSGSWGGDGQHPEKPVSFTAWSKEMLGWIVPQVITGNQKNLTLPPVNYQPVVFKLWKEGNVEPYISNYSNGYNVGKEYFLIEYRQKSGFDKYNHSSGLLVWHIDNWKTLNNDESHYMVDLEEADGSLSGRGDSGDPFPGTSKNRSFDNWTEPNSLTYDLSNSEVALINISDPDSIITLDIEVVEQNPMLIFDSYRITDQPGNNNNRAEAGETVELYITLQNLGAALANGSGRISTADSSISILKDSVAFEPILFGEKGANTNDAFIFTVAESLSVHLAVFNISMTNINSEYRQSFSFEILIGHPEILLVDDDYETPNDPALDDYYRAALDSSSQLYNCWNYHDDGIPTITALSAYKTVAWFTGTASPSLTNDDIQLLQTFLDAGGNLLISGQDIWEITGTVPGQIFYRDYLHAQLVEELSIMPFYVSGNADDAYVNGARYIFNLHGSAQNQTHPDVISPINGATTFLEYIPGNTPAAVKYDGSFKVVYLAFGFEAISSAALNGPKGRADLMTRILEWFNGVETGVSSPGTAQSGPLDYALDPCYPNPFFIGNGSPPNGRLTIGYQLPKADKISITLYDILGRTVKQLVTNSLMVGKHRTYWNGEDNNGRLVASGTYFLVLKTGQRKLARKIAVIR